MKKIFVMLVTAMMVLSGCEFHTTKVVDGACIFTDYITAAGDAPGASGRKSWVQQGAAGQSGCFVYQEFRFNEITRDVLKYGAVMVYMIDASTDKPLPYISSFEGGRENVNETISFEVEKGLLRVVVTWDDLGIYDITESLKFKVCIFYPEEE